MRDLQVFHQEVLFVRVAVLENRHVSLGISGSSEVDATLQEVGLEYTFSKNGSGENLKFMNHAPVVYVSSQKGTSTKNHNIRGA